MHNEAYFCVRATIWHLCHNLSRRCHIKDRTILCTLPTACSATITTRFWLCLHCNVMALTAGDKSDFISLYHHAGANIACLTLAWQITWFHTAKPKPSSYDTTTACDMHIRQKLTCVISERCLASLVCCCRFRSLFLRSLNMLTSFCI